MGTRILIAEDDSISRAILGKILDGGEFDVVAVTDGDEAWKALASGPPFDLCIFDVTMPGLDGLELTRRLRGEPRLSRQKVILCTALHDRSTVEQAIALSVDHFIVKPFSKDTVLQQVQRLTQEQPLVCQPTQDPEVVAARLGIDTAAVCAWLGDLAAQIDGLTTALRAGDAAGSDQPPVVRVNALKGAAMNLGADVLAQRLISLEAALAVSPSSACVAELDLVDAENALLKGCPIGAPPPQ